MDESTEEIVLAAAAPGDGVMHRLWVVGMMMIASFASGALATTQGWAWLKHVSLIAVSLTGMPVRDKMSDAYCKYGCAV